MGEVREGAGGVGRGLAVVFIGEIRHPGLSRWRAVVSGDSYEAVWQVLSDHHSGEKHTDRRVRRVIRSKS